MLVLQTVEVWKAHFNKKYSQPEDRKSTQLEKEFIEKLKVSMVNSL